MKNLFVFFGLLVFLSCLNCSSNVWLEISYSEYILTCYTSTCSCEDAEGNICVTGQGDQPHEYADILIQLQTSTSYSNDIWTIPVGSSDGDDWIIPLAQTTDGDSINISVSFDEGATPYVINLILTIRAPTSGEYLSYQITISQTTEDTTNVTSTIIVFFKYLVSWSSN